MEERLWSSIAYEEYSFAYDQTLERVPGLIEMKKFAEDGVSEEDKYKTWNLSLNDNNFEFNFSSLLWMNPEDEELKEAEYHYLDKKYKISNDKYEAPLCIYSAGYNVFSSGKFNQLFESLARQNYTNYHLVYVDDNSPY